MAAYAVGGHVALPTLWQYKYISPFYPGSIDYLKPWNLKASPWPSPLWNVSLQKQPSEQSELLGSKPHAEVSIHGLCRYYALIESIGVCANLTVSFQQYHMILHRHLLPKALTRLFKSLIKVHISQSWSKTGSTRATWRSRALSFCTGKQALTPCICAEHINNTVRVHHNLLVNRTFIILHYVTKVHDPAMKRKLWHQFYEKKVN